MTKFYEIKGRIAITGNPMMDAKLLGKFQAAYDELEARFVEVGGTIGMRIMTEKDKSAPIVQATTLAPEPVAETAVPMSRHRATGD